MKKQTGGKWNWKPPCKKLNDIRLSRNQTTQKWIDKEYR